MTTSTESEDVFLDRLTDALAEHGAGSDEVRQLLASVEDNDEKRQIAEIAIDLSRTYKTDSRSSKDTSAALGWVMGAGMVLVCLISVGSAWWATNGNTKSGQPAVIASSEIKQLAESSKRIEDAAAKIERLQETAAQPTALARNRDEASNLTAQIQQLSAKLAETEKARNELTAALRSEVEMTAARRNMVEMKLSASPHELSLSSDKAYNPGASQDTRELSFPTTAATTAPASEKGFRTLGVPVKGEFIPGK